MSTDPCAACGRTDHRGLYEHRRRWLCFDCLPPEFIHRYPGWREREALAARRADQAKRNFAKNGGEPMDPG